jgi:hypothetical protein
MSQNSAIYDAQNTVFPTSQDARNDRKHPKINKIFLLIKYESCFFFKLRWAIKKDKLT